MTSITLRVADLEEPITVELPNGGALLIGRNPDLSRVPSDVLAALDDPVVRPVRVASQRVSGTHLLVYHTPEPGAGSGCVRMLDLNSRNGSWLQISPRHEVVLQDSAEITADLAVISPPEPELRPPKNAEWSSEREYAPAVVKALTAWLDAQNVPAEVRATPIRQEESGEGGFLLADGSILRLELPLGNTHSYSWNALLDRVRVYVNEQNSRLEQLQGHEEGFILASRAMREAHRQIADAGGRSMRLMLLGPTGAGKDRMARCYHRHSPQQRGPYASINCALLKEGLLYAQLFGAKKGSFTGSVADIPGVIEAANDGTLFLDEVGDMDLEVQKALLRFLDSRGEYQRLGDPRPRRANVQIVCATNHSLDDATDRIGRFRDDLWYRLAVKVVRIPPLSERREDVEAFLRARTLRGGSLRVYDALTPAALLRVLGDPWPGNFRDLENFVERLPSTVRPQSIDVETCDAALREGGRNPRISRTDLEPAAPAGPTGTGWDEVSMMASAAFVKDHGGPPLSWGQIQLYTEKYLKPVFIAHTCGLAHLDELAKNLNYSELARRLNIADGTTVKMHLLRYIERFRRPKSPDE